jgi:predicted enzyme related to lactoylglutathione lyase
MLSFDVHHSSDYEGVGHMATLQETGRNTTITGMDLVGCTVVDVPRSLAFYRDALDMTPALAHEQGAEFYFPDGTTLGIWKPDENAESSFGVMFSVGDAKAARELFRSRGAKIGDPFESSVCVMAIGEDPDGNEFVIHQRTAHNDPPAPPHTKNATSVNGIDWAGFLVSDPKRSIAFYRDVLGLTPTEVDEAGRGAEFTLKDGSTFGVWRPEETPEGAPLSGGAMMFAVDDPHATVAKLRERGIEIGDVEDGRACFMALTQDPDGIGVLIHKRKDA